MRIFSLSTVFIHRLFLEYSLQAKVEQQIQPYDVLSYVFTYQNNIAKEISENCSLSNSGVWKSLNKFMLIYSGQHFIKHYWTAMRSDITRSVTLSWTRQWSSQHFWLIQCGRIRNDFRGIKFTISRTLITDDKNSCM